MDARELVALAERVREHRKLKYMGDCKCGDCQLVPFALLDEVDEALRAAAQSRIPDGKAAHDAAMVARPTEPGLARFAGVEAIADLIAPLSKPPVSVPAVRDETLADCLRHNELRGRPIRDLTAKERFLCAAALSQPTPCPGCDGHECDDGCQYPGVSQPAPVEAVLVPVSALQWLFGEGPDADGNQFDPDKLGKPSKALGGRIPPYWWRKHFRKLIGMETLEYRDRTIVAVPATDGSAGSKP